MRCKVNGGRGVAEEWEKKKKSSRLLGEVVLTVSTSPAGCWRTGSLGKNERDHGGSDGDRGAQLTLGMEKERLK